MTDLFAVFGEQPHPWLEPEVLKAKYHELSALHHPDVAGATADFSEINRAFQTLSDPAARLRHLLDLFSPGETPRTQPVPPGIAAFFTQVSEARQAVDTFLKKQAAATSPLAKALLSTEQYRAQELLEQTIAALSAKQESLIDEVRESDAVWLKDRPAALARLAALWQSLSYTVKWLAILRESLFQLASL